MFMTHWFVRLEMIPSMNYYCVYVCVCEKQKERKSKQRKLEAIQMQRKTHKDDRLNIISWGQIRLINLELAADLIKQEEHYVLKQAGLEKINDKKGKTENRKE